MEKYGEKVAVYAPYDPRGKVLIKRLDGTIVEAEDKEDFRFYEDKGASSGGSASSEGTESGSSNKIALPKKGL
jgi:hypothetical protein